MRAIKTQNNDIVLLKFANKIFRSEVMGDHTHIHFWLETAAMVGGDTHDMYIGKYFIDDAPKIQTQLDNWVAQPQPTLDSYATAEDYKRATINYNLFIMPDVTVFADEEEW